MQQETFGPVLTLQVFEHEEEGVALANRSEYGLAAGVWTRDVARAFRVARKIRAGTVWINDWAKVYDEFEEGGYRQSGLGRLNEGRRPGRLRRIQAHQPDHRRGLSLGERCGRRRRPLLPGAGIHVFAEQLGQSGNLLETQHLVIVHAQFAGHVGLAPAGA